MLATLAPVPGPTAPVGPIRWSAGRASVLASAFHPELTTDRRLHRLFARMAGVSSGGSPAG